MTQREKSLAIWVVVLAALCAVQQFTIQSAQARFDRLVELARQANEQTHEAIEIADFAIERWREAVGRPERRASPSLSQADL